MFIDKIKQSFCKLSTDFSRCLFSTIFFEVYKNVRFFFFLSFIYRRNDSYAVGDNNFSHYLYGSKLDSYSAYFCPEICFVIHNFMISRTICTINETILCEIDFFFFSLVLPFLATLRVWVCCISH